MWLVFVVMWMTNYFVQYVLEYWTIQYRYNISKYMYYCVIILDIIIRIAFQEIKEHKGKYIRSYLSCRSIILGYKWSWSKLSTIFKITLYWIKYSILKFDISYELWDTNLKMYIKFIDSTNFIGNWSKSRP